MQCRIGLRHFLGFVLHCKKDTIHSKKINHRKVNNLSGFLKNNPKAKVGYYIYIGDYHYDKELKICYLPAWAL
jgi:hypothetical protein